MLCRETRTPPRSRRWEHRGVERHRVYGAARRQSLDVDISHPPICDAQAVQDARRATHQERTVQRVPPTPNQLRWRAMPIPAEPTDFIDGIVTIGGNGDPASQSGAAIHMRGQYFYAGPVFLQRGWRTPDRSAGRRPHRAH